MDITLTNFQLKAIADLTEAMDKPNREIVLKSCTGSGKTIILTHFMDEYFKSNAKTVFVWLTPGKGNLEEQSKDKSHEQHHNDQSSNQNRQLSVLFYLSQRLSKRKLSPSEIFYQRYDHQDHRYKIKQQELTDRQYDQIDTNTFDMLK